MSPWWYAYIAAGIIAWPMFARLLHRYIGRTYGDGWDRVDDRFCIGISLGMAVIWPISLLIVAFLVGAPVIAKVFLGAER